jgi:hypothetical protein
VFLTCDSTKHLPFLPVFSTKHQAPSTCDSTCFLTCVFNQAPGICDLTKHREAQHALQSRPGLWLCAIVLGMISLQFVTGRMKPEPQRPGAERDDLVLNKAHLPEDIHGWTQSSFEAAKPAEQLAEGQFWWTHSWNYVKPPMAAYVAIDQANWTSWHELTMCYQAIGWTLTDRKVIELEEAGQIRWPVVVATFEKLPSDKATLIFSMFGQDGTPLVSPFSGLPPKAETPTENAVTDNLRNRLTYAPPPAAAALSTNATFDRVIQCQVLVQHTQELPEGALTDLIDLHHQTRLRFRSAWLNHYSQLKNSE